MNTKSSITRNNYVPGTSRAPRSITTLRAQMEDLARGQRIKALRKARHLTQPAIVEALDARAGARVVTLRGYQAWEAGGGIRWDNAKLLAEVLGVDAERLMSGVDDVDELVAETAEPRSLDGQLEQQLARLEEIVLQNQQLLLALATEAGITQQPAAARALREVAEWRERKAAEDRRASRSAPAKRRRATG